MEIVLLPLYLWPDTENFYTYPSLLGRLEEGFVYKSIKNLALALGKNVDSDSRMDDAFICGLLGLVIRNVRPCIYGLGYFDQVPGGFMLSSRGKELRDAYSAGGDWIKHLFVDLLRCEVRCRVLVLALLDGGTIHLPAGRNTKNHGNIRLTWKGQSYRPFSSNRTENKFNDILIHYGARALGPYWLRQLEDVDYDTSSVNLVGALKPSPSLKNISRLRVLINMFRQYECLVDEDGGYKINKLALGSLLPGDLREDFGLSEIILTPQSLKKRYLELVGPMNRVIYQELIKPFIEGGYTQEQVEEALYLWQREKKFFVITGERGNRTQGRGFLGRDNMQLIQCSFFD